MELAELAGTYDAIFSLGENCLPAIQLERNGIRPFAGAIDWMDSKSLPNISRLLANRFEGFMERPNMRTIGSAGNYLLIHDDAYGVIDVHDFPLSKNTETDWPSYPEFKEKMNRRIERFFEKTAACRRILFIRTAGTLEQAAELQKVLAGIVRHDFRVLLVNHAEVGGMIHNHWPLPKVCAMTLPLHPDIWHANDPYWETLLAGVRYQADA